MFKKKIKKKFLNYKFFKRFFDFTFCMFPNNIFIPIFILIAFFIKASSRGPVFLFKGELVKIKKNFLAISFEQCIQKLNLCCKK